MGAAGSSWPSGAARTGNGRGAAAEESRRRGRSIHVGRRQDAACVVLGEAEAGGRRHGAVSMVQKTEPGEGNSRRGKGQVRRCRQREQMIKVGDDGVCDAGSSVVSESCRGLLVAGSSQQRDHCPHSGTEELRLSTDVDAWSTAGRVALPAAWKRSGRPTPDEPSSQPYNWRVINPSVLRDLALPCSAMAARRVCCDRLQDGTPPHQRSSQHVLGDGGACSRLASKLQARSQVVHSECQRNPCNNWHDLHWTSPLFIGAHGDFKTGSATAFIAIGWYEVGTGATQICRPSTRHCEAPCSPPLAS